MSNEAVEAIAAENKETRNRRLVLKSQKKAIEEAKDVCANLAMRKELRMVSSRLSNLSKPRLLLFLPVCRRSPRRRGYLRRGGTPKTPSGTIAEYRKAAFDQAPTVASNSRRRPAHDHSPWRPRTRRPRHPHRGTPTTATKNRTRPPTRRTIAQCRRPSDCDVNGPPAAAAATSPASREGSAGGPRLRRG